MAALAESTEGTPAEPGLQADQRLIDRAWLRIGAGLAVAAQAMVFSLAVSLTPAEGPGYWIVHGGLILSALGVLGFLGGDLVSGAWQSVRARRVSIDLLFIVTLIGALTGSLVSTFSRTGAVYYEIVSILVVVHTAGRMLGARSRTAALRAAGGLRGRFDRCDVIRSDGRLETRPVRAVTPADRVRVAPGGAICVDGEIVSGRGYVQEAPMTGEWRPVPRGPGDLVLAGTHSVDGVLEIKPAAGPRRLDGILAEVEQARLAPSVLQRQADRLMGWFLPVVIVVSAGTFAFWWWQGPWDRALFNAMAVLLVACPCAMGLATPVAVWGGLARMASFGLVARTGDFLDVLARCDTVCFDKTGTLSEDRLGVIEWRIQPAWRERAGWLRSAVAAAEGGLNTPVALALTGGECLVSGDTSPGLVEQRVEPGLGVVARVSGAGGSEHVVRVGERGLHARPEALPPVDAKTVFVSVDGEFAAAVELGETWRSGLVEALAGLRALGIHTEVLTGDPHPPADLGLPVRGGLTPAQKQARVRELVAEGRTVVFAGDGVNDAAAMSAAAGSVAMGGGSELARAASMAVFAGTDLRFLPRAVRLARSAVGGIRGNLIFASVYNFVGMTLAATGMLHPVAAALLMVGSSALVSLRALRSSRNGVNEWQTV